MIDIFEKIFLNIFTLNYLFTFISVNITVKVPPKIKMERSKISVAVGESRVNLACVANGDRPINVKWTKVREQLTQKTRKFKKKMSRPKNSSKEMNQLHGIISKYFPFSGSTPIIVLENMYDKKKIFLR